MARTRMLLAPPLLLVGAAAALLWLLPAAAAETPINDTSTAFLYTLDPAGSPYLLSHDFTVLPGGTLFVGAGVELQFENGARLVGSGGDISVQGTAGAPAVLRGRPGAPAPGWGGVVLGSGSDLAVSNAVLHNASSMVTANAGSSVWMDRVTVGECGTACILVQGTAAVSLANASFSGGVRGYEDFGTEGSVASNLSFANFSGQAVAFRTGVALASWSGVVVEGGPAGVLVSGVLGVTLGRLEVHTTTGPALAGNSSADVRIHNSTLRSDGAVAVDMSSSNRLTVEDSTIDGAAGAARIPGALSPLLRSNTLTSASGACLELPGVLLGRLEANRLVGCARALLVPRGEAAPNASAGPSNTLDGRPFLWVDGGTGVTAQGTESASWGLAVLVGVSDAQVTDLDLEGDGVYLFGCRGVRLERLHVASARVGITAVGSPGLQVVAYRAEDVGDALVAWSDGANPNPADDILVERARVAGASGAGFDISAGSNVTIRYALVEGASVGVRLEAVAGAMVSNALLRGSATGMWVSNSTDVVLVDSEISGSSVLGLLVENTTGFAARNAFVDNADHASAPGSSTYAFNELLAGNHWDNWSAPDANGDGWADIPYNLTDGTGADMRPRMVRWDFHPAALPAAPARVELGFAVTLDSSPSFDDFSINEVYWQVTAPGDNSTGAGPSILWTPNVTGLHTVVLSVVGSFGATNDYAFPILVVDTRPPTFTFAPLPAGEAGSNLTVTLTASDNDPAFPGGALVDWQLSGPPGAGRSGNATGTTFSVRVARTGDYTLEVTLRDAAGNEASGTVSFRVDDTTGPVIQVAFEGEPDLGLPFVLDAAASFDPSGLDAASAEWTWVEGGTVQNLSDFPVADITFTHAGNYTVALHLCDALANCATYSFELVARDTHGPRLVRIHVAAPHREAVDILPGSVTVVRARAGEEVVFEAFAEDPSGEVTFLWDFGDGQTAEGTRVVHAFARSGDVTVTVTMTDPLGNTNPAAFPAEIAPGAGLFGEVVPGVSGDLVVLVAAIAVGGVVALLLLRRRKRPREPTGATPSPPAP